MIYWTNFKNWNCYFLSNCSKLNPISLNSYLKKWKLTFPTDFWLNFLSNDCRLKPSSLCQSMTDGIYRLHLIYYITINSSSKYITCNGRRWWYTSYHYGPYPQLHFYSNYYDFTWLYGLIRFITIKQQLKLLRWWSVMTLPAADWKQSVDFESKREKKERERERERKAVIGLKNVLQVNVSRRELSRVIRQSDDSISRSSSCLTVPINQPMLCTYTLIHM